jgi:hypothetical protein
MEKANDGDKVNDGGPCHLLTVRDWLAGQALAGLISAGHPARDMTAAQVARAAYDIADAMIEVRG